ncbi:MAG: SAVED domain-containing protein [Actinomycetota bacterium]|nr:SAVED domain-containing protein [Actinomycetota bacterium]
MITDPTGKTFISYRRRHLTEIERLVLALHDHGVPTWQDVTDLNAEPTPDELRRVLADSGTAGAMLWITPDVEDSPIILKIEVPGMLARKKKGDGFFVQPVAAGGLDYGEAAEKVDRHLGVESLQRWNLEKAEGDPIEAAEAARIADLVLRRRIKEINRALPPGEPLQLRIHTRGKAPFVPGVALNLDWAGRFEGRLAGPEAWDDRLLPAVRTVAATVRELASERPIEAEGLCSLPAAMALGAAFLAPSGPELRWRQRKPGREDQEWSLSVAKQDSGIETDLVENDASSEDVAVLISINRDVEEAVKESADQVPNFRGYVLVRGPNGEDVDLETPQQAVDAAYRTVEAIKRANRKWRGIRRLHLFMAAPAGFAVMFGQLVNGLGPVQTYEHLPQDAIGVYRRAALLHPGA